MLRQIFILFQGKVLYQMSYGKAIEAENLNYIFSEVQNTAFSKFGEDFGSNDYFKHKISYMVDKETEVLIIFITGLTDDINRIKAEILKLKLYFLDVFKDSLKKGIDKSVLEVLNPIIESTHRSLRPKISLVGFSGVGKTTITRLIRAEEIPTEHIPTITGEVDTIKIGKLHFNLWDFAGQDQFSFLWNKFIRGSDAVLVIVDSTLKNIEKSKYFFNLISEEAPLAHVAIIANKQDLSGALKTIDIDRHLGMKTYAMTAIDPDNRNKMIQIIADILEMNSEISPLLQPLFIRDKLIKEAQIALEKGDLNDAARLFYEIGDKCNEIGDYSLSSEFFTKGEKIQLYIKNSI